MELLLGALLTAAVILLTGLVLGWLLLPLRPAGLWSVFAATGDGADLEQTCYAWLFLRRFGVFRQRLILVDFGLSAEGRAIAEALTNLSPEICLSDPAGLETILNLQQHEPE